MQGPNMMNGDPAGLDFDFPRGGIIKFILGDSTSKNPVQMMIQNRSPVRARNDEKAAIFFRHIIDANPYRQQVVIGKRIPGPILPKPPDFMFSLLPLVQMDGPISWETISRIFSCFSVFR